MKRKYFSHNQSGQSLTEYALIIALVAIVVIGVLSALGGSITGAFKKAGESIDQGVNSSAN